MPSKLGFHIQQRPQGWPETVAYAVPAVVKSLEWGILDEWRPEEQTDPVKHQRAEHWTQYRVFLLGRHLVTSQGLDNPADRAYEFWHRLLADLTGGDPSKNAQVLARMRYFDAWEGYNEVGSGPDIAQLGQFDALLARYFHREEMRYAGGGFSMTKPTLEEWPRYCTAVMNEVAAGRGDRPDFLHFHEYWWPPANWGELLRPDGQIDADKMRRATQGYMNHWRDLYQLAAMPAAMKRPVIITECGWDQGWPQQVGFRASTLPDEEYLKWLLWYDQELQQPLGGLDYVVGAAIYTYGHTAQWASFEIGQENGRGILDRLAAHLYQANPTPHPQAWRHAWDPIEPPIVEESHYVLMAQGCSQAWRHTLEKYLHAFRATNGQSLDDALRMAAARHHITLVGSAGSENGVSQAWEDEIRRRNPQVLIDRLAATTVLELRLFANRRVERNDRYGALG
jgi:hypothetical protein